MAAVRNWKRQSERTSSSLALRRSAEEAVDEAAAARANVAVAVGRKLLEHDARRHFHPPAVDQRAPGAVVLEVRAGRPAIAFDTVHGAVAARIARARLLQFLVPVVILGVALA